MVVLLNVIGGIVSALFYGWTSYIKQKENFDMAKMMPTVILGAVVGAVAGYTTSDYSAVYNAPWIGFATVSIENMWKYVWRFWLEKK